MRQSLSIWQPRSSGRTAKERGRRQRKSGTYPSPKDTDHGATPFWLISRTLPTRKSDNEIDRYEHPVYIGYVRVSIWSIRRFQGVASKCRSSEYSTSERSSKVGRNWFPACKARQLSSGSLAEQHTTFRVSARTKKRGTLDDAPKQRRSVGVEKDYPECSCREIEAREIHKHGIVAARNH